MASTFNFNNFHHATTATFIPCPEPARKPDFISPSGSEYWDMGDGVIRRADHFGRGIRSCNWFIADPLEQALNAAWVTADHAWRDGANIDERRPLRRVERMYAELVATRDGQLRTGFCSYSNFEARF